MHVLLIDHIFYRSLSSIEQFAIFKIFINSITPKSPTMQLPNNLGHFLFAF